MIYCVESAVKDQPTVSVYDLLIELFCSSFDIVYAKLLYRVVANKNVLGLYKCVSGCICKYSFNFSRILYERCIFATVWYVC